MSPIEELVLFFQKGYYAIPVMALFEIIAIAVGLRFARNDRTGVFFTAYLIFDFSILMWDNYIEVSPSYTMDEYHFIVALTNPLISCFELLAYYYYFIQVIKNKTVTQLMKILRSLFIAVMVIFVTTRFSFMTNRFVYVSNLIGALEFLFLLPACFVYFYEILKYDPLINLSHRPSFWIVTGIFFYSVLSIPFYLLSAFFDANQYEHWLLIKAFLFYLPFTINFIFLTRAFLCKKPLTI
jgi:hypothetical protein